MGAFGFYITGLVVCLTQQVVLAASDFFQSAIDNIVLLSNRLFPFGNTLIKKKSICRIQILRSHLVTNTL